MLYEGIKVAREVLLNKYAGQDLNTYHSTDLKLPIAVPTEDGDIDVIRSTGRVRVPVG
jgi:hypothetical protein